MMSILKFRLRRARVIRVCISILGMATLFLLINFEVLPFVARSQTISVYPAFPQAQPGPATADLLKDFRAQNFVVVPLDSVAHPYLTGTGTLLGLAGDNIQVFEYPTSGAAESEASAIFGRAPETAAKSFFHLFLRGNLIVLYFGHNTKVLEATEKVVSLPVRKISSPR